MGNIHFTHFVLFPNHRADNLYKSVCATMAHRVTNTLNQGGPEP